MEVAESTALEVHEKAVKETVSAYPFGREVTVPVHIFTERLILIRGNKTKRMCPPGYDYCWECGHVDTADAFRREDECTNPKCPRPDNWND